MPSESLDGSDLYHTRSIKTPEELMSSSPIRATADSKTIKRNSLALMENGIIPMSTLHKIEENVRGGKKPIADLIKR